jgi:hypothetical protein
MPYSYIFVNISTSTERYFYILGNLRHFQSAYAFSVNAKFDQKKPDR